MNRTQFYESMVNGKSERILSENEQVMYEFLPTKDEKDDKRYLWVAIRIVFFSQVWNTEKKEFNSEPMAKMTEVTGITTACDIFEAITCSK